MTPSFLALIRNERGSMIIQVVAAGSLMLLLVLSGMKAVRVTIQSSNTAATALAAKELMLTIRHALSNTNGCEKQLKLPPPGPALNSLLSNPKNTYPTEITALSGLKIARTGPTINDRTHTADYELIELTLTEFRPLGRQAAALTSLKGRTRSEWFQGQLTIMARRRNEFIGGSEMRESIPILLSVSTSPPINVTCTTREIYQITLGPGPSGKSGLECIDRGGYPVLSKEYDYPVCRLPWISLNNCNSMNKDVFNKHPEGWNCIKEVEGEYIYAH